MGAEVLPEADSVREAGDEVVPGSTPASEWRAARTHQQPYRSDRGTDADDAFDSASRRKGLRQLDSLPAGSALIIAPSNAIHTFFMRFAIDVAFVARDGRVLKLRRDLKPWRMAAAWRGLAVIELPVGALDLADTRPGDALRIAAI